MKEQITTWLFLLLLGSSYNVETALSQTTIHSFPLEKTNSENTIVQSADPSQSYTYQWKEENGEYTLSGTGSIPNGTIATYPLPSSYFYKNEGRQLFNLTIKNIQPGNDEISLMVGVK